jgi:hypothetical protein
MLEGAMYLDATEEKMLRAIAHSAVVAAAAGRSFAGEFRQYKISATRLMVDAEGMTHVEVKIVRHIDAVGEIRRRFVLGLLRNCTL